MSLHNFEVFATVCQCANITKAAQKLHMAQPAVSRIITNLESEYSVKLFDRISNKLYITESGSMLYQYVTQLLSLNEQMQETMRSLKEIVTIRVGASMSVGSEYIIDSLNLFSKSHPGINVDMTVNLVPQLEEELLCNKLDFAVLERRPRSSFITHYPIPGDPLTIICPANHKMNGKRISAKDLCDEKFLLWIEGSNSQRIFIDTMSAHGVDIKPSWESASAQLLIDAVANDFGLSVLPYFQVQRALKSNLIGQITIEGVDMPRNYFLSYHKNKLLSPAVTQLIDIFSSGSTTSSSISFPTDIMVE